MNARKTHFQVSRILALTLAIAAVWPVSGAGPLLPKPTGLVTDTAAVLLPGEAAQLEARLQRLRESRLAEAIVYIASSLPEDAVLEDLTLRAVNAWGIGDAATNNGVAIFVFVQDRKVRIEVGLGLEARISDAAAAAIIKEQIAPSFRETKYAKGLNAAIDRIETLLRQDAPSAVSHSDLRPRSAQFVKTALGQARRIVGPANAPRVVRRVYPRYPAEARRARMEGLAELEVLIDASGKVRDVTIRKDLPDGLGEAAVEAVRQWVFEPVVVNDVPVPALIDVVMNFRL
jgi:TonB family protein